MDDVVGRLFTLCVSVLIVSDLFEEVDPGAELDDWPGLEEGPLDEVEDTWAGEEGEEDIVAPVRL